MIKHLGTVNLETERLTLRRIEKNDAEALQRIFGDSRVAEYNGGYLISSVEKMSGFISTWRWRYILDDSYYCWGIVSKEINSLIGHIAIHPMSSEIGYSMNPEYWGKGYTAEALTEVLKFLFNEVGYSSIEAYHAIGNERSRRVLEKCGFSYLCDVTRENDMGGTSREKRYIAIK